MMKEIIAERTSYIYLYQDDKIPESINKYKVRGKSDFMTDRFKDDQDIRVVLIQSFLKPDIIDVYYLFWNDGTDLKKLDEIVRNGTFTDAQFKNAVKTTYQRTTCFECSTVWHTLVIPPGDPYLGHPGLYDKKYALSTFLDCPECKSSLRQMVVKIFYPQIELKEGDLDPAQFQKNVEVIFLDIDGMIDREK